MNYETQTSKLLKRKYSQPTSRVNSILPQKTLFVSKLATLMIGEILNSPIFYHTRPKKSSFLSVFSYFWVNFSIRKANPYLLFFKILLFSRK